MPPIISIRGALSHHPRSSRATRSCSRATWACNTRISPNSNRICPSRVQSSTLSADRRLGIAINSHSSDPLSTIAAPVFGLSRIPRAVLTLGGLRSQFDLTTAASHPAVGMRRSNTHTQATRRCAVGTVTSNDGGRYRQAQPPVSTNTTAVNTARSSTGTVPHLADVHQTPGSTAAPTPTTHPGPTAATDHPPQERS